MINRPCLCRLDRKIPNQSSKSLDFNRQAATACVDAAKDLLSLIPDEPNAVGLLRVGPWWSVLHWLVQATTVLMLEISFRTHHMPEEADVLTQTAKKGVRWLHALGEDNRSARRAWQLCYEMLQDAVSRIGRDASDMPQRPPGRSPSSGTTTGYGQSSSGVQNYSAGALMSTSVPQHFPAMSHLDQMMHFDQYFPMNMDQSMGDAMPMPSEAEMEFMTNAYHDGQGHQQSHQQGRQQGGGGQPPYN
jgi:hypothetical protein